MNEGPETDLQKIIDGAGPIAGLFVLVLLVAVFLLWWSMNRQLKRIDPSLKPGYDDELQARDREYTAEAVARGEQEAQARDAAAAPPPDEQPGA